jgi:DASS family divalent anion:Na+ symporter
MGEALGEFGVSSEFARWLGGQFTGWTWPATMAVAVLIYFYAHYALASITTHLLTLYAPFLALLIAAGAPAAMVAYALLFYANLSASLTHYGTTHSPMVFSAGYVSMGSWWRTGFLVSIANLLIWTTVGLVWWKWIGLW